MYERDFDAAQEFLLAAKNYWTTTMYCALRDAYNDLASRDTSPTQKSDQAITALQDTTIYRYFAWLERHLQRMKYTGRYGLIPFHTERRSALLDSIGMNDRDEYSPELHPELPLPDYYKFADIHQHQGGLYGDEIAGLVYEYGARSTTPLLGETHDGLHSRFTELAADGAMYKSILDMGCGFGKSTGPFITQFPDAQVEGIDLSAPCLMLAAETIRESGNRNVRYRQRDAQNSNYEDESFDLVTSTMLLHELPVDAINGVFDEAFRLLRPGGRMIHLDFYVIPDDFRRFIHYGHAVRNNEPYMHGLAEMDLNAALSRAGFNDISLTQFRESSDVDLDANNAWRFPWTVISAVKPT